ncbi:MAG: nucleoside hydrolase [Acidobacteriota bacterium]|nr:nucleoside hydrolase [Acidobacteriota bacterium]
MLDSDPGIDDAMAILLATQSPELQIEAITVVSGNVLVDQGVDNALKLVELAGRTDIPVARGEKYPLRKKLITAPLVHGKNGLGETELPTPTKTAESRHAVDLIIDLVRANPGQITLLPMGPLTNIARVLLKRPDLAEQIPEIILMGGSIEGGNATPAAEANIYNDPEAAKIVFESGIPITMVGLGATHQTLLQRSHTATLAESQLPIARYVAQLAHFYLDFSESVGFEGGALHDPLAVGLAVDSSLANESRPMHIAVETQGRLTYGETVANRFLLRESVEDAGDHYVLTGLEPVEPNAQVPVQIDADRFLQFFMDRICAPPRILE